MYMHVVKFYMYIHVHVYMYKPFYTCIYMYNVTSGKVPGIYSCVIDLSTIGLWNDCLFILQIAVHSSIDNTTCILYLITMIIKI